MFGGDNEDLLSDLPPLGIVGEDEERHEEELEFEVSEDENVGLDADASGEELLDPADLLDTPNSAGEGAWLGEQAKGLSGQEDDEHDLDAGNTEYGWAAFGQAPGDDDWDDGFQAISSPPVATSAAEGAEAGVDDEGLDEPLGLPPLDAGEAEDDDEDAEIEPFLRPEDFESPLGVDR